MDIPTILIFIILLALSAFFSGTEIALMSIPYHKIETLLKQGVKGAADLKYIKEHSDRLLITILIGNNLVNTYTAAYATTIAMNIAQNSGLDFEKSIAIGVATGIVTLLILLFGEIAPKSFATKNKERISLMVSKFYRILMMVLYPLVVFIEYITKLFTGNSKEEKISEKEIEAFIDLSKESGVLEQEEYKQLKNLLKLYDTPVENIMIPRIKIDKLSDNVSVKEALDYILAHTHSRIPVYHKDIDHVIGIVNMRILLEEIKKGNGQKKLSEINLIKPQKVPLTMPIDDLLKKIQETKQHLAIVIDKYGGVAGVVALEDIIEEVFGEIQDETDKEEIKIKKISDNEYIVSSTILIDEALDLFKLKFSDFVSLKEENYSGETISYVITDILERFPVKNEKLVFDLVDERKLILEVLEIKDAIIGKVALKLIDKKLESVNN